VLVGSLLVAVMNLTTIELAGLIVDAVRKQRTRKAATLAVLETLREHHAWLRRMDVDRDGLESEGHWLEDTPQK
jgi:hypothetical protein